MPTRQYIGARYVPKFYENSDNTSEWRSGVIYEPLTIVTYNSNSYTSKKEVPASVGNPSANPEYWVATGNYSAQVEEYRQEVQAYQEDVDKIILKTEDIVNIKDYGAIGDGVADDTDALKDFIADLLQGKVGFIPEGTYLITQPIVFDYSTANTRQLKMFGAGSYRSTLKSTINSGIAFLFTSGSLFDSFHTVINDIGFTSMSVDVTLQIGKDDYSDSQGNYNFTNVFVANNSDAAGCVAAKYNYLFDCVFVNCIYVCTAHGKGTSLLLRLCRFCTFIGGSYSNANKGIDFNGSGCDTLTFIGSDFENLNYGVYITSMAQYVKFITCYFDIWRPDLTPPTYGTNAVYSELANFASTGLIIFDNCLFARAGIYGSGGIDRDHIYGCKFIGNYSYPSPATGLTVSPATFHNNSGMDLFVYAWVTITDVGAKITYFNILDDTFANNNTNVQCGPDGSGTISVRLPVGATLEIGFSGTLYWKFLPLNT